MFLPDQKILLASLVNGKKIENSRVAQFDLVGEGGTSTWDQAIRVGFGNLTPATFASFAPQGGFAQ